MSILVYENLMMRDYFYLYILLSSRLLKLYHRFIGNRTRKVDPIVSF